MRLPREKVAKGKRDKSESLGITIFKRQEKGEKL